MKKYLCINSYVVPSSHYRVILFERGKSYSKIIEDEELITFEFIHPNSNTLCQYHFSKKSNDVLPLYTDYFTPVPHDEYRDMLISKVIEL